MICFVTYAVKYFTYVLQFDKLRDSDNSCTNRKVWQCYLSYSYKLFFKFSENFVCVLSEFFLIFI